MTLQTQLVYWFLLFASIPIILIGFSVYGYSQNLLSINSLLIVILIIFVALFWVSLQLARCIALSLRYLLAITQTNYSPDYTKICNYPHEVKRLAEAIKNLLATINHQNIEIQANEARYRLLTAHLPNTLLMMFNPEYRYVLSSGGGLEKMEFETSRVEGKTLEEVYPAELIDLYQDLYSQVLQGEEVRFEHWHRQRIYDVHLIPVYHQHIICFGIAITRDITLQRQFEKELLQNQNFINRMMETSPAIIWVYDLLHHQMVYCNRYGTVLLGYAYEELMRHGRYLWGALHHPDDQNYTQSVLQHLREAQDEEVVECECRLQHIKGNYLWIHSWQRVLNRLSDGTVHQIIGVADDITAQKQIEFDLRATQEQFELAMRGASDGLWDWAIAQDTIYYSPRWKDMLGYSDAELGNYSTVLKNFLHPNDAENANYYLENYLAGQQDNYETLFRLRHKTGYYVWILSRAIALRDTNGKATRIVGTHVDMTAYKQLELELTQAKEAAESANRLKSSFLANISHELRTPLHGIMGFTQLLLRDTNLTGKQKQRLEMIQKSGEHLISLLNDLLDIAKIEANDKNAEKLPLDIKSCHLNDFLKSIVEMFKVRAEQRSLYFRYLPAVYLPDCFDTDEKRLRQVLINLLANAIKFTEQGEVCLRVEYVDEKLFFHIQDTGIGIAPEHLTTIFQPFMQVSQDKYRVQGTGLGLSISYHLVAAMKGCLTVNSEIGKGSTFTVMLPVPLKLKSKTGIKENTKEITGYKNIKKLTTKFCILVVDDEVINRQIIRDLLMPLGFDIIEAADGYHAVEQAHQQIPDLILLDLVMKGMSGYTTARQLRQLLSCQNTPIILLSAHFNENSTAQCQAAGCNAFLPKPLDIQALYSTLEEYLPLEWVYE